MSTTEASLEDFTNEEIKAEYIERFGDPDDYGLNDFSSSDLIDELESRDAVPVAEGPDGLEEIADLIAEAAHDSKHALRAYGMLLDSYPDIGPLAGRQRLIIGRMSEAA